MKKTGNFGFKTPVRRITKNITGNKVGGELSGGEVVIKNSHRLFVNLTKEISLKYHIEKEISLFNSTISILAFGGYFFCEYNCLISLSISFDDFVETNEYILEGKHWYSMGVDMEVDLTETSLIGKDIIFQFTISSENESYYIDYSNVNFGMIDYEYFKNNDVYSHYSNSKKHICFPEQFYFTEEYQFENSQEGSIIYKKSCNRCQRFLPINPVLEREQLSSANHCSTKAPCTHSNFSNYEILENSVELNILNESLDESTYSLKDNFLYSYYGHQLECKACKKFFVNAALNKLRSSTQHREDSLRRRAIELMTNKLLAQTWIYHKFRLKHKKEFDREIWLKFDKKCFNCKEPISSETLMHLDHTMPLSYLYPLDEHATCLCSDCNNRKRDAFPVHFYSADQLVALSTITGLPQDLLISTESNNKVVLLLKENIKWFIEDFLTHQEYLKDRDGKTAANSILHSVQKAVNNSISKFDISEEYQQIIKEKQ